MVKFKSDTFLVKMVKFKSDTFFAEKLQFFFEYYTRSNVIVCQDGFVHRDGQRLYWLDGACAKTRVSLFSFSESSTLYNSRISAIDAFQKHRPDLEKKDLYQFHLFPCNEHSVIADSDSLYENSTEFVGLLFDHPVLSRFLRVRLKRCNKTMATIVQVYLVLWKNIANLDSDAKAWLLSIAAHQVQNLKKTVHDNESQAPLPVISLKRSWIGDEKQSVGTKNTKVWHRATIDSSSETAEPCEQWYLLTVTRLVQHFNDAQVARAIESFDAPTARAIPFHQKVISSASLAEKLSEAAIEFAMTEFCASLAKFLQYRVQPELFSLSWQQETESFTTVDFLSSKPKAANEAYLSEMYLADTGWYYDIARNQLGFTQAHSTDGFNDLICIMVAKDAAIIDPLPERECESAWFKCCTLVDEQSRLSRVFFVREPAYYHQNRYQQQQRLRRQILIAMSREEHRSNFNRFDSAAIFRMRRTDDRSSEQLIRKQYGEFSLQTLKLSTLLAFLQTTENDKTKIHINKLTVPCSMIVCRSDRILDWYMVIDQINCEMQGDANVGRNQHLLYDNNTWLHVVNAHGSVQMRIGVCLTWQHYRELTVFDLLTCDVLLVSQKLLASMSRSLCTYLHEFQISLHQKMHSFDADTWMPYAKTSVDSMLRKTCAAILESNWMVPLESVNWHSIVYDGDWPAQDRMAFEVRKKQILPSVCKREQKIAAALGRFCQAVQCQSSTVILTCTALLNAGSQKKNDSILERYKSILLPLIGKQKVLPRNAALQIHALDVENSLVSQTKPACQIVPLLPNGWHSILIDCVFSLLCKLQSLQALNAERVPGRNSSNGTERWMFEKDAENCQLTDRLPSDDYATIEKSRVDLLKPSYRYILHWVEHNIHVAPTVIHNVTEQIMQRTARYLSQIRFDMVDGEPCGNEIDDLLHIEQLTEQWQNAGDFERESQIASEAFYSAMRLRRYLNVAQRHTASVERFDAQQTLVHSIIDQVAEYVNGGDQPQSTTAPVENDSFLNLADQERSDAIELNRDVALLNEMNDPGAIVAFTNELPTVSVPFEPSNDALPSESESSSTFASDSTNTGTNVDSLTDSDWTDEYDELSENNNEQDDEEISSTQSTNSHSSDYDEDLGDETAWRLREALRIANGPDQRLKNAMPMACAYYGSNIVDYVTGVGWSSALQAAYLLQRAELLAPNALDKLGYQICLTSTRDRHLVTTLATIARAHMPLEPSVTINQHIDTIMHVHSGASSLDNQAEQFFGPRFIVMPRNKELNCFEAFYRRLAPALLQDEKRSNSNTTAVRLSTSVAATSLENDSSAGLRGDEQEVAWSVDINTFSSNWQQAVSLVAQSNRQLNSVYNSTLFSLQRERYLSAQMILHSISVLIELLMTDASVGADLKSKIVNMHRQAAETKQYVQNFSAQWSQYLAADVNNMNDEGAFAFIGDFTTATNHVIARVNYQYDEFRDHIIPFLRREPVPMSTSLRYWAQQVCTFQRNTRWLTFDIEFILRQQQQMPERFKTLENNRNAHIDAVEAEINDSDPERQLNCSICLENIVYKDVALFPCGHSCCSECYKSMRNKKHSVLHEDQVSNVVLPIGAATSGQRCHTCRYILQQDEQVHQIVSAAKEVSAEVKAELSKASEQEEQQIQTGNAQLAASCTEESIDGNDCSEIQQETLRNIFTFTSSPEVLRQLQQYISDSSELGESRNCIVASTFAPCLLEVQRALQQWVSEEKYSVHTMALANASEVIEWRHWLELQVKSGGKRRRHEENVKPKICILFHHIDLMHSLVEDEHAERYGRRAPPVKNVDLLIMCESLCLRLTNDKRSKETSRYIQNQFLESIDWRPGQAKFLQIQTGLVDRFYSL